MKIRVLKGTDQIGGCITEITSDTGARIIIDYGSDLESKKKFPILGLTYGKKAYDAVFITHNHEDHIGLIEDILEDIPIYVEEVSFKIFQVVHAFTKETPFKRKVIPFSFEDEISIGDLKVIPYRTDHSAYHSCMFLVTEGKRRLLHLGDYRSNGYSSSYLYENLAKIKAVDVLLTEGTGISRGLEKNKTEEEVKEEAKQIMNQYKQVFVLQASSNIDRIRTFYEASKETDHAFLLDVSAANILKSMEEDALSYLKDPQVSVWVSNAYQKEKSTFLKTRGEAFKTKYIEPFLQEKKNNRFVHGKYTMLIKCSSKEDIVHNLKRYRDHAALVYSLWSGYKDPTRENTKKMVDFIKGIEALGIPLFSLHTSGHADVRTMEEVNKRIKTKMTIGIHTEKNGLLQTHFTNFQRIYDQDLVVIEKDNVFVKRGEK